MYDGAKLDFAENVATTRRVVDRARTRGVLVEAELGEIGGKDGAHAPGVRTDPDEARGSSPRPASTRSRSPSARRTP